MQLEVLHAQDVTVVAVIGTVDSLTAERLQKTLAEEIGAGGIRIVVDCARLEYTSSAGLRTLLAAVKDVRTRGGDLRLAAALPPVRRVLDLAGFTSILKLYDDRASAAASFT